MNIVDLPLDALDFAPWNPNQLDEAMHDRLRHSITTFGNVGMCVVRPTFGGRYELLAGNQRCAVLRDMGHTHVACCIVQLDDASAKMLAQALNHVHGVDDIGLKAEVVQEILQSVSQEDVLRLLPESRESLEALSSLGQADIVAQLQAWESARSARLHHFQAQLVADQLSVVERALEKAMSTMQADPTHPNRRGQALFHLCTSYLELTS